MHSVEQKGRFTGSAREKTFLEAYRLRCLPGSDAIAAAEPAGPCAFYPMNDSWVDQPFAERAVLIGDAAGWNDPIIGQGLSIALRDARMVADIVRAGGSFRGYADERRERMRRLRRAAEATTDLKATFTPKSPLRRRRYFELIPTDSELAGIRLTPILGPDVLPAEVYDEATRDRILALA